MSIHTIGIDIGSGAVKTVLFGCDGDRTEWARCHERVVIASSCGPNIGSTCSTK